MTLKDNLVSVWELSEASGNALDSHGSHTATETSGTIGAAAGPGGLAGSRDFELSDSEGFAVADHADLDGGDTDFSIACWVMFESLSADQFVISKWQTVGNLREYALQYNNTTSRLRFVVTANGSTIANAEWGSALSTGVWYYIAGGHNAATNEIWLSVDSGTPVTTSHSGGVFSGTADFWLGARQPQTQPFDGLMSQAAFWRRDIRADLSALYNAGDGLAYADWDAEADSVSAGLATEQDVALPVTWSKAKAISLATEQDASLTATWSKAKAIGLSAEQDLAQAFAKSKTMAIGLSAEQDTALQATWSKAKAISLSTEQDLAQTFTITSGLVLGQAVEQDIALTATWSKRKTIGLATEQDLAFSIIVWTGTIVPFASVSLPTRNRIVQIPTRRRIIQVEDRR